MTRAEAVKYLKAMKDGCNDTCHKVRYVTHEEALEMAIQALSQEPCDDSISRQAAIESVKQAIYNHDSAIMRLTELPSVTQPRKWIPVSERLPEDDDLYLITFDDGEIDLVTFDRGAFSYSGVIAWMPLPKPYEPQESEEGMTVEELIRKLESMPQNVPVYAEGELADKVILENCQGNIYVRIFKAWDVEFAGRGIEPHERSEKE